MELRRLRYFLTVAEELSFTRAAARLQMAQPPLSTQIQVLESELGTPLFDRSRRAIALTAAGRALVPEARRLLADAEQTARIVRHAADGTVGRLGRLRAGGGERRAAWTSSAATGRATRAWR